MDRLHVWMFVDELDSMGTGRTCELKPVKPDKPISLLVEFLIRGCYEQGITSCNQVSL